MNDIILEILKIAKQVLSERQVIDKTKFFIKNLKNTEWLIESKFILTMMNIFISLISFMDIGRSIIIIEEDMSMS